MDADLLAPDLALAHADSLTYLPTLPDHAFHAVICDPPYGLEFQGEQWDSVGAVLDHGSERGGYQDGHGGNAYSRSRIEYGVEPGAYQAWCEQWVRQCYRLLKPGGWLLAFSGTRTGHRLTCAVEDSGFEVRDSIAWLHAQGFPKSKDVSKAIDAHLGATREVLSTGSKRIGIFARDGHGHPQDAAAYAAAHTTTAPASDDARTWSGWGTALKPAHENIVVARKPYPGPVARNVLAHRTGAVKVSGTRWPSNVALDPSVVAMLDPAVPPFYFCAKPGPSDRVRDGISHPTAKPLALVRWLVRTFVAQHSLVLDPFVGSGTTMSACRLEQVRCLGVENTAKYLPLIEQRLARTARSNASPLALVELKGATA